MGKIFLIGAGGFFGAILRYLVSGFVQLLAKSIAFPYGTLAVNFIGCLMIGFLGRYADTYGIFIPEIRVLVFIGFLGGFTTFSTFGNETVALLRDGNNVPALLNIGAHIILCLGAVWAGQAFAIIMRR